MRVHAGACVRVWEWAAELVYEWKEGGREQIGGYKDEMPNGCTTSPSCTILCKTSFCLEGSQTILTPHISTSPALNGPKHRLRSTTTTHQVPAVLQLLQLFILGAAILRRPLRALPCMHDQRQEECHLTDKKGLRRGARLRGCCARAALG